MNDEHESPLRTRMIEEYVLGLCDAKDKERVEQMAAADPKVKQIIDDTRRSMEQYCQSVNRNKLALLEREKLLQRQKDSGASRDGTIRKMYQTRLTFLQSHWYRSIAVGMAFIGLVATAYLYKSNQQLLEKLSLTESQNIALADQVQDLQSRQTALDDRIAFIKDQHTLHLVLKGTKSGEPSMAIIYWNAPKQKAVLQIMHMPEPPAEMTYQLWADVAGEMTNLCLISLSDSLWHPIPYMEMAESLNLTLEEKGGSSKPNVAQLVGLATL